MSTGTTLYFLLGLVAVVGLLVVVLLRSARRPKASPNHYATALNQLIHDDWDGALASLRRAIQSGHTSPDAYIKLGSLLRRRGDTNAAFRIHQNLTVRQDLTAVERAALSRCLVDDHRALGQRLQALRILQQMAANGRDPGIQREIAEEALASGEHAVAVKAIREAQKQDPQLDAEALARFVAEVGESCFERGHHGDAKRYFQEALKEDDACPAALLRMGDLAAQDGDHESALYYWQKLAFASPQGPDLYERLERVYFELGKFGDIERVYAQILEKRPRDLHAMVARARIAAKKGDVDEAERLLRAALDQKPDSRRAFQMLASLLLENGRIQEARALIDAHFGSEEAEEGTS